MDLALNNLHKLICHKTQPTNQPIILRLFNFLQYSYIFSYFLSTFYFSVLLIFWKENVLFFFSFLFPFSLFFSIFIISPFFLIFFSLFTFSFLFSPFFVHFLFPHLFPSFFSVLSNHFYICFYIFLPFFPSSLFSSFLDIHITSPFLLFPFFFRINNLSKCTSLFYYLFLFIFPFFFFLPCNLTWI